MEPGQVEEGFRNASQEERTRRFLYYIMVLLSHVIQILTELQVRTDASVIPGFAQVLSGDNVSDPRDEAPYGDHAFLNHMTAMLAQLRQIQGGLLAERERATRRTRSRSRRR